MLVRILNKVKGIIIGYGKQVYYCRINKFIKNKNVHCTFLSLEKELNPNVELLNIKLNFYLQHRYDLLGSGWVTNSYNSIPLGVSDYKYHESDKKSLFLKQRNEKYIEHNWQLDVKSGYSWKKNEFCKKSLNVVGVLQGVDIKMPWEMSRFYHLPYLALLSEKDIYAKEIKNQIFDFKANNPVGKGVNWSCTMDVGIRINNILICISLCNNRDVFDEDFEKILSGFVVDHGKYIYNNLENNGTISNNHYLANLLGLVSIAYFTRNYNNTQKWLLFAYKEFLSEFKKQFHSDGSNFEGSTAYHCLSSEIYVLFTAYILGLPEDLKNRIIIENGGELFPDWYISRLYKSGLFIKDIMKSSGRIAQIGDNDSGHIFKVSSCGVLMSNKDAEKKYLNLKGYCEKYSYDESYWDEDLLNKRYLMARYDAIFQCESFKNYTEEEKVEYELMKQVSKDNTIEYHEKNNFINNKIVLEDYSYRYKNITRLDFNVSLNDNIRAFSYPDFGIFGICNDKLHLVLSIADNGLKGKGGHAHNDKLSFDLEVDEIEVFTDPGSFIYHPLPVWRNKFRSTKAHNTIVIDNWEQNDWEEGKKGIFRLKNEVNTQIVRIENNLLEAKLTKGSCKQLRQIEIFKNHIEIRDYCSKKFKTNFNKFSYFSNGYGKILYNKYK